MAQSGLLFLPKVIQPTDLRFPKERQPTEPSSITQMAVLAPRKLRRSHIRCTFHSCALLQKSCGVHNEKQIRNPSLPAELSPSPSLWRIMASGAISRPFHLLTPQLLSKSWPISWLVLRARDTNM